MLVKRGTTGNYFTTFLQFKQVFSLNIESNYKISFKYLINVDICNSEDITLEIYFYIEGKLNQPIFNSTLDTPSGYENVKWNDVQIVFRVDETDDMYLAISAKGYCETEVNNAFVALDQIHIWEVVTNGSSTTKTSARTVSSTITITETETTTTGPSNSHSNNYILYILIILIPVAVIVLLLVGSAIFYFFFYKKGNVDKIQHSINK